MGNQPQEIGHKKTASGSNRGPFFQLTTGDYWIFSQMNAVRSSGPIVLGSDSYFSWVS